MSQNDLFEDLLQFLKPGTLLELKEMAVNYTMGLSATEDGIKTILSINQLIRHIMNLADDKNEAVARDALLVLVNITTSPTAVRDLLKQKTDDNKSILESLIGYVLDQQKKDAGVACMVLTNITRIDDQIEVCVETLLPHLDALLNAFVHVDFNKKGSSLDYLAPMFGNISCSQRIRKWLTEGSPHIPLTKLLPFCNYEKSSIRRGGIISTVRNLTLIPELHDFLLNPERDLLSYLLKQIIGNENYPDEEMDKLPISLQYLPQEKRRDLDIDIRKLIVEALNKLCTKRNGREVLRENGVYYVLREYHKWERDPRNLLACENVIDILIQEEAEVGTEDFSTVDVPEDMIEKFEKMDKEYLQNVEKS